MFKLLVVDDSRMMRQAIARLFRDVPDINIVAEAENGKQALQLIPQHRPDVITLDINMPEMDGLTTLKHLMIQWPTPTVMLSSLTLEGARITFDALRYGAVDFITKPSRLDSQHFNAQVGQIVPLVQAAAAVEVGMMRYIRPQKMVLSPVRASACQWVVALGVAEGGYSALLSMVPHLPVHWPVAYIVAFHGTLAYMDAFIDYLNQYSAVQVKRLTQAERVMPGVCYLSTGEDYVTAAETQGHIALNVHRAPFASQRGSIDRLLFSLADVLGERVIGVILSGQGEDGREGMAEVIRMGGITLVQDPVNCLYKEMPQATLQACRVDAVVLAREMVTTISRYLSM